MTKQGAPGARALPEPSWDGQLAPPHAPDVVLLAPSAAVARLLLEQLAACRLTCDRVATAADLEPVLAELPAPRLVLLVSDNQLERARARHALSSPGRWDGVPVLEVGRGALSGADLALLLAGHARGPLSAR